MPFPQISIVNDPSSGVADADLEAMVAALQKQVDNDFEPVWHTRADLVFVASGQQPQAGTWTIVMLDNSDQAGALGYHDLTPDGLPLGKVFAGTDRQYNQIVSVTLSHELLEMLGDPWINLSAQADDGKFYALETCDAVEADALGYPIDGVTVSDFCLPAWWGHGAGVFDHGGHVTAAFQLAAGGYISVFDPSSGQGWTQVQGAAPASAAEAVAARPRVGSRRERRFSGSGTWVRSTYPTV